MKLVGYIKDKKQNAFQVPVYSNAKGTRFFHTLDERYNITDFIEATFEEKKFQRLYLSKKFEIADKAAIIFLGSEGYLHYNVAPTAIEEIIHYLNDHNAIANFDALLDEAMLLKNRIFSDHFVVDNFVLKMDPNDEQIILSFDFPSPKANTNIGTNTAIENPPKKPEVNTKIAQENEAIFTKAIKQLNSVDMNFELKLKLRAEERRNKLKTFNYQFKLNQNSSKRKKTEE
ncbi:hypothetical protein G4D82_02890 [Flavobacterium sp. CYK-4]|uniref:hypothetical protein n=1 Tax=Flavobacterium lotistagni TaxID=2709660 RepID=UPI0014092C96|nr:hypothetical protein [Flavobacterium lotistagni]NHM06155.1 hypothetical protein [Flavobacterium lotistagni]